MTWKCSSVQRLIIQLYGWLEPSCRGLRGIAYLLKTTGSADRDDVLGSEEVKSSQEGKLGEERRLVLREKHKDYVAPPGLKEHQRFDFLCTCSKKLSIWIIKGLELRTHYFYEETGS